MYTLPKAGPSIVVHLIALAAAFVVLFGKKAVSAIAGRK
jgi:hypothetical protein